MLLNLEPSLEGSPTCAWANVLLHSSYDPIREAQRFLRESLGESRVGCLILKGPCLDYLTPLLKERNPHCLIVSLQYDPAFVHPGLIKADATWHPQMGIGLEAFLDMTISEDVIFNLKILEWKPATLAFPSIASVISSHLTYWLGKVASSAATTRAFGKRWIVNACTNFLKASSLMEIPLMAGPMVIAAAGPSLGDSLDSIAQLRDSFNLVALSSSLSACHAAGYAPDLVVATDGGFWSGFHFKDMIAQPHPIAAPLTFNPGQALESKAPYLPINQGSLVERRLLAHLGAHIDIPSHGTVAGTALALSASLGAGPIIFAGLDLASRGELEHARPHAFEPFLHEGTTRLKTINSKAAARVLDAPGDRAIGEWRHSRSLAIYASALSMDCRRIGRQVFRLNPSSVDLPAMPNLDKEGFFAQIRALRISDGGNTDRNSTAFAGAASLHAVDAATRRLALMRELSEWKVLVRSSCLCLESGSIPDDPSTADFLRSIDLPDWTAACTAIRTGKDPKPSTTSLTQLSNDFLESLTRKFSP